MDRDPSLEGPATRIAQVDGSNVRPISRPKVRNETIRPELLGELLLEKYGEVEDLPICRRTHTGCDRAHFAAGVPLL